MELITTRLSSVIETPGGGFRKFPLPENTGGRTGIRVYIDKKPTGYEVWLLDRTHPKSAYVIYPKKLVMVIRGEEENWKPGPGPLRGGKPVQLPPTLVLLGRIDSFSGALRFTKAE